MSAPRWLPSHVTRKIQAERAVFRAILDLDKGNGVTATDLAEYFGRSNDEGFLSKIQKWLSTSLYLVSGDGEHFSLDLDSPAFDELVSEEYLDEIERWDLENLDRPEHGPVPGEK